MRLANLSCVLLAALVLGATNLNAQEGKEESAEAEICKIKDLTTVRTISSSQVPSWFFKPFASKEIFAYASTKGNFLLDYGHGKNIPIPGNYDPVPTPDEKYLTIPGNLTFYKTDSLLIENPKKVYSDSDLGGVYQSVGLMSETKHASKYRVITDSGGLSATEYLIIHQKTGSIARTRVTPLQSPYRLCSDYELNLPIISKDGRMLAGLDLNSQTTKIFKLDEKGKCTLVVDLGISTGKVDFHFNNDDLAFHVTNINHNGKYFETPDDELVLNVFLYRISTKELRRVTFNTNANSYYPGFRKDGKLVYIHLQDSRVKFVIANPEKAGLVAASWPPKTEAERADRNFHALTYLGYLWNNLCKTTSSSTSVRSASLVAMSLERRQCLNVLPLITSDLFESMRRRAPNNPSISEQVWKSIKMDDLKNACSKLPLQIGHSGGAGTSSNSGGGGPVLTASPIPQVCNMCHQGHIPFQSLTELKSKKARSGRSYADEIRLRVNSTDARVHMPPAGFNLSEVERAKLIQFLDSGT